MEEGRGGAEQGKFGAVQQYCGTACLLPWASKALAEVSSVSHRQQGTAFFKYRYVEVGESGTLQCKFLASADFVTSDLFVVVYRFAEL